MATKADAGTVLVGGLFIGVWVALWLTIAPEADESRWFMWGVVGLALAGATYGARVLDRTPRLIALAGLGILVGFLITHLVVEQEGEGFAALFTFLGGWLIGTALPGLREDETPVTGPAGNGYAQAYPVEPAYPPGQAYPPEAAYGQGSPQDAWQEPAAYEEPAPAGRRASTRKHR